MSLSTQPYKGARDFYPEDKRVQNFVFSVWRQVAERFGYEAYDAPLIEPIELYLAKTGQEIVTEQTYVFTDRGGREVAIRPEMTPTVSRMVAARRQELAYPLRWYSIPNLWRYERPQRGRLREHWQLNVDLFGISGLEAEHEIIMVADAIMRGFGAKPDMYAIQLNSRRLMDFVLGEYLGLDETQQYTMTKLIDRMHKIEHPEFIAQADTIFTPTQREAGGPDKLHAVLGAKSLAELPEDVRQHASANSMTKLFELLAKSKITNVRFEPSIMRGFDYYTDIVFEVVDTNPDNNRSMFGGGRYDGLVGLFGVEPVPTIGFGMGDVTLINFLETHGLLPELRPPTDAYVVLIGGTYEVAQPVLAELREMGVNLALDDANNKVEKGIKNAEKKGIRHVVFIGEKELADEQFSLKDLKTGQEERHGIERLVSILKDYRRR